MVTVHDDFDGHVIDPARHEVLRDGDYIRELRRKTNIRTLFLYRHRIHKTFVLCSWVVPGRTCIELTSWQAEQYETTAPPVHVVLRIVRPAWQQAAEMRMARRELRERKRQEVLADTAEANDIADLMKKKGYSEEQVRMIRHSNRTSEFTGGEAYKEARRELLDTLSGKIISC